MTPWHFGPGLLGKAVLGPAMSFSAFALTQIVMDAEVVARFFLHIRPIHGFTHTLAGGAVVFAACAVAVATADRAVRRRWGFPINGVRLAATLGSAWGVLSHLLLDAWMHHDVRLFWPVTDAAPLHEQIGIGAIHDICFWTGAVGLISLPVLIVARRRHRRTLRSAAA